LNNSCLKPKKDPTIKANDVQLNLTTTLLFACCEGDLQEIQRLCSNGADIWCHDYDKRTPLHLSASEGHEHVVNYFIRIGRNDPDLADLISPRDRWGRTPLDDAVSGGHQKVAQLLSKYGAKRGDGINNDCSFSKVREKQIIGNTKLHKQLSSNLGTGSSPSTTKY
jgi:ankyrin repeat protein